MKMSRLLIAFLLIALGYGLIGTVDLPDFSKLAVDFSKLTTQTDQQVTTQTEQVKAQTDQKVKAQTDQQVTTQTDQQLTTQTEQVTTQTEQVTTQTDQPLTTQADQQGFTISWPATDLKPIPLQPKAIKLLQTFTQHTSNVVAVAFSPKGNMLASGSRDNTIKLWRVADNGETKLTQTLKGHTGWVRSVAFSSKGSMLASGSGDNTIKLWRAVNGSWQLTQTLKGHAGAVFSVAFSSKGNLLASGSSDGALNLWQVADNGRAKLTRTLRGHTGSVSSVAFSPKSNNMLASGSNDNTIKLWRVADNGDWQLTQTLKGHKRWVNSVAFSPKGNLLASGSSDGTLKLWQVANNGEAKLAQTLKEHRRWINSVAFSPKGNLLASGSYDNTVKLWRMADNGDWQLAQTLKGHVNIVEAVAFSIKGNMLASGSDDKTVKLWGDLTLFVPALLSNQKEMLAALQQQRATYLEASLKLALIPEPVLPAPKIETKAAFESKAEFSQRISRIKDARNQQIAGIQKKYQQQVEARNQRLKHFQANREHHQNTAMAKAFQSIYGQPALQAMHHADGEPDYNAEQYQLHVELTFSKLDPKLFKRKLVLAFPDNRTGEAVYKALAKKAIPPISINWNNQQGSIALTAAHVIWEQQKLTAKPSTVAGFEQAPLVAQIGASDQLNQLLQNPVLKDAQFELALAKQRQAFKDDIPALLQQTKAVKIDNKKWLFVIGVGNYQETNNIIYSKRSARLFAKAAAKVLGIDQATRQYLLFDDQASSGKIKDSLTNLANNVRQGDSIYFYFSGHGVPSSADGNNAYMLPVDRIPQYISGDAYFKLDNIYQVLLNSKASHIFAFMDSCFSGRADNNSVYGQITGSVVVRPKAVEAQFGNRMTVLTAGTSGQYSTSFPKRGHRMFSYYLIKALLGRPSTFAELATKVQDNVSQATQGASEFEQTPDWLGSRVLRL